MRIKHEKPKLVDPDWTPMIDMTFQLIAFFMVVSNFEQTNADERVKLPADKLARPPIAPREDEIMLNVGFLRDGRTGEKTDPNAFVFYGDEPVKVMDYKPRLQREFKLAEQIKGREKAEKMTVVIRADGDVSTGLIQELIKMGQESGFSTFALKAKAGEEED